MILKIKNSVLLVILASYASGGFGAVKGDLSNTDEVLTPSEASVLYTTETQVEAITRIDRQLLGIQGNSNVEGSPIRCSHVLMHSTTASYDGFPSVAYFPTVEKLFSVFRSGVSHADAEGALHGMESYDFGQTWTSPYLMFDDPVRDVRDPSLLVLSDGRLFMTYTKRYNVGGTNDLRNVCFRISEDSGNTFGDEVVFNTGTNALFDVERLANSTGITELSDGTILLPFYEISSPTNFSSFIARTHVTNDLESAATWSNAIAGVSATIAGDIHMPNETDIIEFEPGIITAVIRCENDSLRYNDSYDYGVTWQGSQPAQITPYDWNPCKPESIYVGNGRVMTLMRTDGQGGFEQSFMTSYDRAHSYRYAQRYDQRIASMYTELKHVESRGLIIGVSAVIRSTGPTYELWFDVWRTGSARVHNIDHNPEAPLNTNSALVLCESSDASSLSWTNQVGSDILHTGPLALTEGRGYHGENYLSDFSLLNYGEYPGDVKFLHNGDPWSIVVRFRCSDFSSNSGILQTGHSDVHVGINFRMQGGGDRAVQLNIYNGNAGLQPLSVTTRDGTIAEYPKWNTMVIRYDPATVMYTIINNGVISHTPPWATGNAFSTSSPTYSLRVGRGTDVEISHLEIFSEAFTDSELSAISGLLLGSDK